MSKLTSKARRAIYQYVLLNLNGAQMIEIVVNKTLEAQQMPRSALYDWLEERGYRWTPLVGWMKESKTTRLISRAKGDQ